MRQSASYPPSVKTYRYGAAGRRMRMTWRDGFFVVYDYNVTGEMTAIREREGTTDKPVTTGVGVLATFGYDSRGRRVSLARGNNATTTTYAYDDASRLTQLVQNPLGTTNDLTLGFGYFPSSQIVSNTRSNEGFAQLTPAAGGVTSTVDGRNQLTNSAGSNVTHDARGNVTAIGSTRYTYTSENRLVGSGSAMFAYDGLGRLYYRHASGLWWDYDGDRLTAEIDATNTILRGWVHGPGVDEPLVQYEGSGTTNRLWLHPDERGSIVAQSDSTGAVTAINRYDEYGVPATGNAGRFTYTGQVWLAEVGLYYYRARIGTVFKRLMLTPEVARGGQAQRTRLGDGTRAYIMGACATSFGSGRATIRPASLTQSRSSCRSRGARTSTRNMRAWSSARRPASACSTAWPGASSVACRARAVSPSKRR